MKCPGCVTPCEECDKPLPVAEYLSALSPIERMDERIKKLEKEIEGLKSIIQERTADS